MNENRNDVVEVLDNSELELDLRDMLAMLLLRWKTILIFLLVGAIGFAILALPFSPRTVTEHLITKDDVKMARNNLDEEKADMVDRLRSRVVYYTERLAKVEQDYDDVITWLDADVNEKMLVMQAEYYISSNIDNLGSYYNLASLNAEDYEALRKLIPESDEGTEIYKRIIISENSNKILWLSEEEDPEWNHGGNYLFSATVFGSTEKQCIEMLDVVERAFQRKTKTLQKVDPNLKFEIIGDKSNCDALIYLQERQEYLWSQYVELEKRLTNQKNKVSSLSGAEKSYYLVLENYLLGGSTVTSGGQSLRKWAAIGAILGTFVGLVIVIGRYLSDGKVKTSHELESFLHSTVLNKVFVKGKKNLFGKPAASLMEIDQVDPSIKAEALATDIGILLNRNGKRIIYLLCNETDLEANILAEQIRVRLQEKIPDACISMGNPLSTAEGLTTLGAAELGVFVVELKKTQYNILREWGKICHRYSITLLGVVTIQKCW